MNEQSNIKIIADLRKQYPLEHTHIEAIEDVIRIMLRLRDKDGCPWDVAQTHLSLRKNLLEEAYELLEAIDTANDNLMCEELGDLFMQVVFHSQIADERTAFGIGDVAIQLRDKLIRRHPHVFGEIKVSTPEEALASWNKAKGSEVEKRHDPNLVSKDMPSLLRSRKIQEKASKNGFDWANVEDVFTKLEEEINELKEIYRSGDSKHIEEELGDVLFVTANIARKLHCCPEVALSGANEKFLRRWNFIGERLKSKGKSFNDSNLEEMDTLWDEAKATEKGNK